MICSGSESVVIAKPLGVGPLSPPQAASPATEIQHSTAAQQIVPLTFPRLIEIFPSHWRSAKDQLSVSGLAAHLLIFNSSTLLAICVGVDESCTVKVRV